MEELAGIFGIWTWWVVGAVLLGVELLLPGMFFLWFGLAAIAVGFLNLLVPISVQLQIALFAVLSVVLLIVARPWLSKRQAVESEQPNLNRRMYGYIGRDLVLEEPIHNGQGKVKIDDTQWIVEGQDQPKGTWIKVVGVNGARLVVKSIPKPGGSEGWTELR